MCGLGRNTNGNGNGNGNDHDNGNGNGNGIEIEINTKNNNVNGINNNGEILSTKNDNALINLDQGDPKMYFPYWKKVGDKCTLTIKASDLMSYYADDADVFYQMSEFTNAVKRVHRVVGNAVVDDRYIVSGTGSSQLFTVALKALASTVKTCPNNNETLPIPVVCAEPYYSCYAEGLEAGKSEAFQWLGDAHKFDEDGPYIEIVTTPNNPDGQSREAVVNKEGGMVICDLAYYWPQYTPMTGPADYDIMLFTLSKATGHAGSRVGWAIVKDKEIAMAMVKMMTLDTIGTCHEGQLRAAKILDFVADVYQNNPSNDMEREGLFEFGSRVLAERWTKLRDVINTSGAFSLPDFPLEFCNFTCVDTLPNPAYAWMELKSGGDAAKLMSQLKIRTRCGTRFGVSSKYTRVNMMESDESFNALLERLSTIKFE